MATAVWIDLLDPDADTLTRALPELLHPMAVEHLLEAAKHDDEPRPRLERQGDYLFGVLVVPILLGEDGPVAFQELDLIATHQHVLTVRKTPPACPAIDITAVREAALAVGAPPGGCLYVLVDEVAERYLTLVDRFNEEIDELEDMVEDCDPSVLRGDIGRLRHDLLHVRRVLTPTRDLARSVLDDRVDLPGDPELFPHDIEVRFADAYDKLLRATDGLDLSRDLLAGVRDYHQAKIANDQNEVMKRLTVVASLLLLPTLIAGVYGQNFDHMPELHWRYGYGFSWLVIVLTTVGQLLFFKKKRWI
jgi:magnesium transporter